MKNAHHVWPFIRHIWPLSFEVSQKMHVPHTAQRAAHTKFSRSPPARHGRTSQLSAAQQEDQLLSQRTRHHGGASPRLHARRARVAQLPRFFPPASFFRRLLDLQALASLLFSLATSCLLCGSQLHAHTAKSPGKFQFLCQSSLAALHRVTDRAAHREFHGFCGSRPVSG